MERERISRIRVFDEHGVNRLMVRRAIEELRDEDPDMTAEELAVEIQTHPMHGLSFESREAERAVLAHAIGLELSLMQTGETLGPKADPRYLARTGKRASLDTLYAQLGELAEQAQRVAAQARALVEERPDSGPPPTRALADLLADAEDAWATAWRIEYASRDSDYVPPWS